MRLNLLSASVLSGLVVLLVVSTTESRLARKRKFDGDFEFADEEDTKSVRKEGKKTWILDPGSDLCQALKCRKKELCLLEDEYTAVCVSKKELHKNGDIIIPKSKVKDSPSTKLDEVPDSKEYDEDEDDDSDYYDDDDDSDEDLLPNKASSSGGAGGVSNKVDKGSSTGNGGLSSSGDAPASNSFKSCSPCPVVKPTFLCGSDNRTYSSLCRLDYHNCIQNSQVTVSCKGFCPCKGLEESQSKRPSESDRISRFMQKYKKTVANLKLQQQQQAKKSNRGQKKESSLDSLNTLNDDAASSSSNTNSNFYNYNEFASGTPVAANSISGQTFKDRYVKYKDYSGMMSKKSSLDKQRSYNDVMNTKPTSGRDCSLEALDSMGDRLLDWFSVVMADTQKRKLNRKNKSNQIHFPGDCKREVQWMFAHLNTDEDGQLSLQELYDLENDRSEKCIKPFIDRCDSDKDIFISPLEWCNCFSKLDRRCPPGSSRARGKSNCAPLTDRDVNDVDDEDSEIEGSSDGPLEI